MLHEFFRKDGRSTLDKVLRSEFWSDNSFRSIQAVTELLGYRAGAHGAARNFAAGRQQWQKLDYAGAPHWRAE